jgi:hypothetical protein
LITAINVAGVALCDYFVVRGVLLIGLGGGSLGKMVVLRLFVLVFRESSRDSEDEGEEGGTHDDWSGG